MVVELSRHELTTIDAKKLAAYLMEVKQSLQSGKPVTEDARRYYEFTREAVNERRAREARAAYFVSVLQQCMA